MRSSSWLPILFNTRASGPLELTIIEDAVVDLAVLPDSRTTSVWTPGTRDSLCLNLS